MEDRVVRKPEAINMTGLSDSTHWRLEQQGKFPKRRQITPNAVGYLLSELQEWIAQKMQGDQ